METWIWMWFQLSLPSWCFLWNIFCLVYVSEIMIPRADSSIMDLVWPLLSKAEMIFLRVLESLYFIGRSLWGWSVFFCVWIILYWIFQKEAKSESFFPPNSDGIILTSSLVTLFEVGNHLSLSFLIYFPTFFFLILFTNISYILLIFLVWHLCGFTRI